REREIAGPRAIRRALLSGQRLPPPQVDPVIEKKRYTVKHAEHRRERRAPEPEQEHPASDRTNLCTNAIGQQQTETRPLLENLSGPVDLRGEEDHREAEDEDQTE